MEITTLAQILVGRLLREGDMALDATAGNGHDTVFLARAVGETGRVIAFDVQQAALAATADRLETLGLRPRVTLIEESHGQMEAALNARGIGAGANAIMFNLGFLPGGDKRITTRVEETMRALEVALELLADGGILTLVLYPGHPEGARESETISFWAKSLPSTFDVILSRPWNRRPIAPYVLAVEKKSRVP